METQQRRTGNGNGNRNGTANGNGRGTTTRPKPVDVFKCLIPTGKGESVLGSVSERQGEANGQAFTSRSISVQASYYSDDEKKWIYHSRFKAGQLAALNY